MLPPLGTPGFFPTQTWLRQDLCDGLGVAAPRNPLSIAFPLQTWLRQDLCDGLGAAAPRDPDVSVIRFFLHKFFPTQTWLRQDVRDGLGAAVVFLYDGVALLNRRRRSLSEAHRQLCYEKVYEGYRQRNNTDEGDACRIGASAQE